MNFKSELKEWRIIIIKIIKRNGWPLLHDYYFITKNNKKNNDNGIAQHKWIVHTYDNKYTKAPYTHGYTCKLRSCVCSSSASMSINFSKFFFLLHTYTLLLLLYFLFYIVFFHVVSFSLSLVWFSYTIRLYTTLHSPHSRLWKKLFVPWIMRRE